MKKIDHELTRLLAKHQIRHYQAATKLGLSSPTFCHILSGRTKMSDHMRENLETMIEFLKAKPIAPDPFENLRF